MAFSAHKDSEQVREFECDETTLDYQAQQLATWIRQSKHFVAFTGAGISTSAGIPDFRGPQGVWTLRARGEFPKSRQSTLTAVPTKGHMALVGLEKTGLLKFLISQNTDGLHRRSGFPPEKLAELHGNSNLEQCRKCGREFLRDFSARSRSNDVHDHRTTRKCPVCNVHLYDTIINFSESLPEKPLQNGFINARKADLCLVLGSSLTVSPANQMPQDTAAYGGKLVICNMQKTPLDSIASLRVFAKADDLMTKVMEHLKLEIPEWVLKRWVKVKLSDDNKTLIIAGVEPDGIPASILHSVELINTGDLAKTEPFLFKGPFEFKSKEDRSFRLRLHFMGNYNEPAREIEVKFSEGEKKEKTYRFELCLSHPAWEVFEEKTTV
uniref:protein acetyllysine N-acetyltransferase n=1 Tax=Acrobeloides nanus TaxID=290746 RepID=A0A914C8M8_9BILA